jgi:hypothetical protein
VTHNPSPVKGFIPRLSRTPDRRLVVASPLAVVLPSTPADLRQSGRDTAAAAPDVASRVPSVNRAVRNQPWQRFVDHGGE